MLIPINTDAPIYHPPICTVAIIILNTVVFIFSLTLLSNGTNSDVYDFLTLEFGKINPLQWLTNCFMHAGFAHLIGNMIFLWTFGMIVEGKVGWWKFALLYLFIGCVESGITQVLMLWSPEGSAIGASGAIFGLVAITMLWAPKNELTIVFIFLFRGFLFDVPILGFCLFTIGWEIFIELLVFSYSDGSIASLMSSAFLHLLGAGIGFSVGFWFLKSRRVDCDGYDLLTVMKGKEGERVLTIEQEAEAEKEAALRKQKRKEERGKAYQFIQVYLDQGNAEMAIGRFNAYRSVDHNAKWKPEQLTSLIKLLLAQKLWDKSINYIDVYLSSVKDSIAYRLLSAEILITQLSRPRAGIRTLQLVNTADLSDKQKSVFGKLAKLAKTAIDNGEIELSE